MRAYKANRNLVLFGRILLAIRAEQARLRRSR
jgi:hypothetical protein